MCDKNFTLTLPFGEITLKTEKMASGRLESLLFQFLKNCEKKGYKVLVSDTVVLELKVYFPEEKIKQIFSSFQGIIQNIEATEEQVSEARTEWLKREKRVPFKDVLHAVLAKQHCAGFKQTLPLKQCSIPFNIIREAEGL